MSKDLIARLLPDAKHTLDQLEQKYPPRGLREGAMVTRFAPSPTGFVHIGNVYSMLIDKMLAHQSGGVFYLRIEDTDTARTVPGGAEIINSAAEKLGLATDEGPVQGGAYGPYRQSLRKEIYHSVAADLLASGKAYPCFMTQEEMDEIRQSQEKRGIPTGIYGTYARDRDLTEAEISAHLDEGKTPSIRWYSAGDESRKVFVKDVARGSVAIPEWNKDEVLIKSGDGLPTYHFAHLCDDHFMRTTHVVRDESWLGTAALHVMLFSMMGWDAPLYYHTPTLDKIDPDTGNRRKLSKRKDPEFSVANWWKDGWPAEAILEYLFNLIASGYEEEKLKAPGTTIWNYPIKLKKMPISGALFDMKKLEWWAKEFIATLSADEIYDRIVKWAVSSHFDSKEELEFVAKALGAKLKTECLYDNFGNSIETTLIDNNSEFTNKDYLVSILSIERGNPKRIRKDFVTWKQTLSEISYFFDNFDDKAEIIQIANAAIDREIYGIDNKDILFEFLRSFDINDLKDLWWNKIVDIAARLGIKNGDAAMSLRVALTGRTNTPDLYSIMQVMGEDRVRERIGRIIKG